MLTLTSIKHTLTHPLHKSDRERERKREEESEHARTLGSIKHTRTLSVPHSFSQSVSMRDYYINYINDPL